MQSFRVSDRDDGLLEVRRIYDSGFSARFGDRTYETVQQAHAMLCRIADLRDEPVVMYYQFIALTIHPEDNV